ncbi:hypothetical protein DQW52_14880 [Escherichia coli O111:H-]|nr:hypothetical protein DQW52_14880 [Escherichia coli O111:H-]
MLPSETMIWQPEFTDKTLSRKPGAVQGCVANNLDLDVVMIIINGAFSGIVQNWLMNMAGYDLYKQAPALVDNVLRMFMPDENITKLIHQTNELSVM